MTAAKTHVNKTVRPDQWTTGLNMDILPEDPAPAPRAGEDRFPMIDWDHAFTLDFAAPDWLPGQLGERGQQIALVGPAKVGKSLVLQAWAVACVTGRPFLGTAHSEPLKVLYFDRENNLRDVVTRMRAFGATPDELRDWFDYRLHPRFTGGFDQVATAVAELLDIVDESKPDVVVFDTVSRFIAGGENDADTWLAFYNRVHAPLKARGITCVRLDHMGKDLERGARGSSAKTGDVDHVWELTLLGDPSQSPEGVVTRLMLRRTHTRTGLGPDVFRVVRKAVKDALGMWVAGGTSHGLEESVPGAPQVAEESVEAYVDRLIQAGAPGGLGREALRDWARSHNVPFPTRSEAMAAVTRGVKKIAGEAAWPVGV